MCKLFLSSSYIMIYGSTSPFSCFTMIPHIHLLSISKSVYPLSENTVLVIQQLFSNLLSALFIPFFRSVRDVGVYADDDMNERPQYTFSLYLLILILATATVFFSTFNGKYVRREHEEDKKNKDRQVKCLIGNNDDSKGDTENVNDEINVAKVSNTEQQHYRCNVEDFDKDEEQQVLIRTH